MKIKRKSKKKKNMGLKNEILGLIILSLGLLVFLGFYFSEHMGPFGLMVKNLLSGLTGKMAYTIPFYLIVFPTLLIFHQNKAFVKRKALLFFLFIIVFSSIFHTAGYISPDSAPPFMDTVKDLYTEGNALMGGGLLGGLLTILLFGVFQRLGTLVILITIQFILLILITNKSLYALVNRVFMKTQKKGKAIYAEVKAKRKPGFYSLDLKKPPREEKKKKTEGEVEKKPEPDKELSFSINEPKKIVKAQIKAEGIKEMYYRYPPISLLKENDNENNIKTYRDAVIEGARKLEETLRSFSVEARVINVSMGPTITRYELQPDTGVKVSRIVSLADDISLNLASSGVRIEAPIPGKAAVGIEVPNRDIIPVLLRDVIESEDFIKNPSKIAFPVGKDVSGECIIADITKMPHMLIAGATGSGKSVCINSLIMSILYRSSPDEVKLLLIDPKVVELGVYNGIPHLLIPVVTEPKKAAGALNWAVVEMNNRYKLFAGKGVRDIKGYNEHMAREGEETLPLILIIIDELSDLMMAAPGEVEDAICRLAQMARAAGMHLVVATQRPSVDVITGLIKANIPSRISFAVSSQVDSRTILDMGGAEKLLGKGDMLYFPLGKSKPLRVQGSFVSDDEVERTVEFIKGQGEHSYDGEIMEEIDQAVTERDEGMERDLDELLPDAVDMIIETGQASVSFIQRRFKVGYARAARIIDQMESRGIVGGFEGSKPRQILINKQTWDEMKHRDFD